MRILLLKEKINFTRGNNDAYDKKIAFKNNTSFASWILKINNTLIDNAEELDIVMPMYNLLECSKNDSKTPGSFLNQDRNEPNSGLGGTDNNINYSIKESKSFDYKTSIGEKLEGNNAEKKAEIVVPLNHSTIVGEH